MPLYSCNAKAGVIPEEKKASIANDITHIHCDVTGAPPTFVHAFFFEEAVHQPLHGKQVSLMGSIRAGRTDAQKQEIVDRIQQSIHAHSGVPLDQIQVQTADTPARWVMEGGDLLPEPGEEAAWLAAHAAKLGNAAPA